jgi:hypothetical protein
MLQAGNCSLVGQGLLALLSGAVGTGVALFVGKTLFSRSLGYTLDRLLERRKLLGQSDLDFRKQQLAEFYGPIYAYMKLGEGLYGLFLEGQLQDINTEVIALFRRQNEEIVRLIATKSHLIDGNSIPTAFMRFTTSVTLWDLYTARPDQPWFPEHIKQLPLAQWPEEFQSHVYAKTEELKAIVAGLYKKYGIT